MGIELIDFYADWCGPCVVMKPVIEELEKQLSGKIEVKKIDVDENQDLAGKYGVMSIPTYIILKDGQEVDRIIGSIGKEVLVQKVTAHFS